MSFDLTGYILRPARSATSNATSTADADSGVLRDIRDLPSSYDLPGDLVEPYADMYRAAVLHHPVEGIQEYLIWAANSSHLAIVQDSTWAVSGEGTVSIPRGSLSVTDLADIVNPTKTDGTARLILTDKAGRSIHDIRSITIIRGDNQVLVQAGPDALEDFASQDADAGLITLSAPTLAVLGGGVSTARGDSLVTLDVTHVVAAQKFWWTRNDQYTTRFGWQGKTQRWAPYKGSAPINVGKLLPDEDYVLSPRPARFAVGGSLPGSALTLDAYAMVRIGGSPDATSLPLDVLVVTDGEAEDDAYVFPALTNAVVGVTNGILRILPAYTEANAGKTIWYVYEDFLEDSLGPIGPLLGAMDNPLFLCPVPGPDDRPFISLGSRRYLTSYAVDQESDLPGSVNEGEVYWARSTGRIKLSQTDIDKADPDAAGFDILYLAAQVVYDGVALSKQPVPLPNPCQLTSVDGTTPVPLDGNSQLFMPEAKPLPFPGTSGALRVYDNSGVQPTTTGTWRTRAGGTGLVRSLEAPGDKIFFTKSGAFDETNIVEFEKGLGHKNSLPDFPFLIRKGRIWCALQSEDVPADLPRVAVGLKDRGRFSGETVYFRQAMVTPAIYVDEARIYSRVLESYTLDGTEKLAFRIDSTNVDWTPATLVASVGTPESFTAVQVAAHIQAAITAAGGHAAAAYASKGRLVLRAEVLATGLVEIGFGDTADGSFAARDLTGCAALGFLPGWRADMAGGMNWLPDSGMSFGVYRSPLNRDRSKDKPDFRAAVRFNGEVLSKSVGASPYFFTDFPPLMDVPGYDEGVFFLLQDGFNFRYLRHMQEVLYDFPNGRFGWVGTDDVKVRVEHNTRHLAFGQQLVIPDSLHPAVVNGGGLYLAAEGGPLSLLTRNTDYLMVDQGNPGFAHLIEVIGEETLSGSNGTAHLPYTFDDSNIPDWTAVDVAAGYWLKITGGNNLGVYLISSVSVGTLTLDSGVALPEAGTQLTWTIHKGYTQEVYDPGVVADVVFEPFNHLLTEPFKIRLMHSVGGVPADAAAQATARSKAVIAEPLARNRSVGIRFGQLATDPTASLRVLGATELGFLANSSLGVPDTAAAHFVNGAFAIQVGSTKYSGASLLGTASFTSGLLGDVIEYGNAGAILGELNFGADVLVNQASSTVFYVEEFSDPDDLAAGVVEYDPLTGFLNYSAADMVSHGGITAYLVEQLITESQLDARISPMAGALHVAKPLRKGQIVEVSYFQADSDGNKKLDDNGLEIETTEKLPLYVRQEVATRISPQRYAFNPELRTVAAQVSIQVWVGVELQNYGNEDTVGINFEDNEVHFTGLVDASDIVTLSYAVYEAFGGEQTYTVSKRPVFRPPFFLVKDTNTFTLDTDRTAEMLAGKLFQLGSVVYYIKSSAYDGVTDKTTVVLHPTLDTEAGSRSPGHDAEALLSSVPVAPNVDGLGTTAKAGFLLSVAAEYEPVDRGQLHIVFQGDLRPYAQAGHLLEIGGNPHLVAGSELSDDGRYTTVQLSSPFLNGYDFGADAVSLSVRPIYGVAPRQFNGIYPLLDSEEYELVLFGETDRFGVALPGRTLVETTEYNLSPDTGAIELLEPRQAALAPGQRLVLRYTKLNEIGPFVQNGVVIVPRFKAVYAYITTPSPANGYLASVLQAAYTFRSPDTFYCRAVPLPIWMGEVAQLAASSVTSKFPHSGPMVTTGASTDNWGFGNIGIMAEREELLDRDHAARRYISFYNEIIVAFEQIREAVNGEIVGDRDGKFRFKVGRHAVYPPPGFEDEVHGRMNPRLVWGDVFEAGCGLFRVGEGDFIVDPELAIQDALTLEVSGDPMDGFLIKFYLEKQAEYVHNDIDDRVFVRPKFPRLAFPFLTFRIPGEFARMSDPHSISRLFPEQAMAFTTLYPGMKSDLPNNDPGFYSFLRMLEPPALFKGEGAVFGSTFRTTIGTISNPAWGQFLQITDCEARDRLPRARIWRYSETGFPEMDALIAAAGGTTFTSQPRPAIIATVLPLKDFPIDATTGFPDTSVLSAQMAGNGLADLSTGDLTLSTPAFVPTNLDDKVFQQCNFGRPDGSMFDVGTGKVVRALPSGFGDFEIPPRYKGVFVAEVLLGCIITFSDSKDTITDASDLFQIGAGELETSPLSLNQGDTIFIGPAGGIDPEDFEMSDPPTMKELTELAEQMNIYRRFQLGQKRKDGLFVDNTLPSIKDPSFMMLKELLSQKTPAPMSTIEAAVEFKNGEKRPFAFPALKGEPTNDDGDYTIPYMATTNTELDRLGEAAPAFRALLGPNALSGDRSVYPDEICAADGQILAAASGATPPATLITGSDLTPAFISRSGTGPVEAMDLVLVESGQAGVDAGMTGILQIGALTNNTLEVARFVSPSKAGSILKYTLDNAVAYEADTYGTAGVEVVDDGTDIIISLNSLGGIFLNDETSGVMAVGGWNNLVSYPAYPNTNSITLRMYSSGGTLLETLTITGSVVTAGGGGSPGALSSVPEFTDKEIILRGAGGTTVVANTGAATYRDFSLSIDASGGGSQTAYIGTDRLTFFERIDLSRAQPRGTTTTGGGAQPMDARLNVVECNGLTMNAVAEVNGGVALTFIPRADPGEISEDWAGAGVAGDGTEGSSIKVMSWEKHNTVVSDDSSLTAMAGLTFSALPSSSENESVAICAGTGVVGAPLDALTGFTTVEAALLPNIEKGDICKITSDSAGDAAVTVGTYIVRGVIKDSDPSVPNGYEEVSVKAVAPNTGSWLNIDFPTIVSWDDGPGEIVTTAHQTTNSGTGTAWAATGTLFVLVNLANYNLAMVVPYTGLVGTTFTVNDAAVTDPDGNAITAGDFWAAIKVGQRVSGMVYLPVNDKIGQLPRANAVGYDSGTTTAVGLLHLTIKSAVSGGVDETYTYSSGTTLSGTTGTIEVTARTKVSAAAYTASEATFFDDVPDYIDISGMTATEWGALRGATGTLTLLAGIIVGDQFVLNTVADQSGTPGFQAASGIYFEPSQPTPVQDLGDGLVKVVDVTHTSTGISVGMRDPSAFGGGATETVLFEVRRIRRWHDVTLDLGSNLAPLRFAYETRRGTSWTYDAGTRLFNASGGTQLGGFENKDVNINVGDQLRILDANGGVVDTAEIGVIKSGTQLKLRPPGLATTSGSNFEVYLRKAPVPHQQSNEQLLALITEQEVLSQTGNPATSVGGKILVVNELTDGDGTLDYTVEDVRVGDILIVDPAGELVGASGSPASPVEVGSRPFGDFACPDRQGGGEYVVGQVSDLDDNRGHYWITAVAADKITVSPAHEFAGEDADQVFGTAGAEFVVLPTVYASGAAWADAGATLPDLTPAVRENQNDLRPTAPSDGSDSYKTAGNTSVESFSYRIIRPSRSFSSETIDLVLFHRERILSWIEEMEIPMQGASGGTYQDFQDEEHVTDLGPYPNGIGVPFNALITSIEGQVLYSPFANASDCLSVLDRRFWCLDLRLDVLTPPSYATDSDPYADFASGGAGRPVLTDLIDGVLDRTDRFRALRYTWINYRTNRQNGTLVGVDRFDEQLEERLEEIEDLLRIQESQS